MTVIRSVAFHWKNNMAEPTITCPKCGAEIKLTDSLAAPLVEAVKRDYESRLSEKDAEVLAREKAVKEREHALQKQGESIDEQIAKQLAEEREKISREEAKKAQRMAATELDQKDKALAEMQAVLVEREKKLGEAQKAQAELIRKQRELDDKTRELELTVQKGIQEGHNEIRAKALKEAEEGMKLKVAEKEQTITAMQRQIEDLKRRAEQGSQQLQGEVLELELETLLKTKFPCDAIEPVPKGEFGGDVIHRVNGPLGQACGTILWESKRTRNWSDSWLAKLREDQRTAKADISIIVSQALPREVETFDLIEGVWVTHPKAIIPVAMALRYTLIEVASARQASEGRQTKTEMIYQYLTGPHFRLRVQAIVEAFSSMQEDLDREKKVITKQWAKREEQIERVMHSTVGMYGDLQGIAGKSLQEIEGLEWKELEGPEGI